MVPNVAFKLAVILDKSKSKKTKAVAKTGTAAYQWQIMQSLGLKDDDIKKFADANYWLQYFPPRAKNDLLKMGAKVTAFFYGLKQC